MATAGSRTVRVPGAPLGGERGLPLAAAYTTEEERLQEENLRLTADIAALRNPSGPATPATLAGGGVPCNVPAHGTVFRARAPFGVGARGIGWPAPLLACSRQSYEQSLRDSVLMPRPATPPLLFPRHSMLGVVGGWRHSCSPSHLSQVQATSHLT